MRDGLSEFRDHLTHRGDDIWRCRPRRDERQALAPRRPADGRHVPRRRLETLRQRPALAIDGRDVRPALRDSDDRGAMPTALAALREDVEALAERREIARQ